MDYEEYEKQAQKNRKRNEGLLDSFEKWLISSGLSKRTVEDHVFNAEFFINEYLTYYDVILAEEGISSISSFFGDWFIRKAAWASEDTLKQSIASIKKFYSFLMEIDMIHEEEYRDLLKTIKEDKAGWIREVNGGYEEVWKAYHIGDDSGAGDRLEKYYEEREEYEEKLWKCFRLIKSFSATNPWERLDETDVFAIRYKGKDLDDTYFCSILGAEGQIYGVSVYKGPRGIDSYTATANMEFDLEEEAIHIMNTTAIYLNDRGDISKEDYNMIQQSGIKFRGKKQWPSIRVFEPGFLPGYIDSHGLDELIGVLEVLTEYVLYLMELKNEGDLPTIEEGKFVLREYDEPSSFKESIEKYENYFAKYFDTFTIPVLYSEFELKRMGKGLTKTNEIWEVDIFYLINLVEDDGEIFYPAVFMIVDTESEDIIGQHITHPHLIEEFQIAFLEAVEGMGRIPKKVIITYSMNLFILYGVFQDLGIEVEYAHSLKVMPNIKVLINAAIEGASL